ncbi:ABC transporter permease [Candidatus Amarobacter glycogenicus]|uniref:ABC transporter permease n=1 Tax=Candidatus Amarobacter glycogenicus TaxID=3140699 RepID=UPI002A1135EA|nr:ABC transporter permease [Dehalococcoidia bacterium]
MKITLPVLIRQPRRMGDAAAFLLKYDVWLILLAMIVAASLFTPNFLTSLNIANLLRQTSIVGILSIGQFLVILSGGFDLSVAAVMALSSVILASYGGENLWLAIFAAMAAGLLLGLANGLFISRGRMAPFIVTLAMLGIARGLAFSVADTSVMLRNESFGGCDISLGVLSMPAMVWLLAALLLQLLVRGTRTGMHISAIGGREDTARLAGVRVARVKTLVYAASGVLAGPACVLFVARSGSGMPHVGTGWELDTIAAVVIGGTDLFGGEGSLPRAMAGVIIYMMIRNVMNLLGMDPYLQDMLKAVIILAAVAFGLLRGRLER